MYAYDGYGNVCDIWYFDADNEPCLHVLNGERQEHHHKYSYDAMGKKLSEEVFDTDDKPTMIYGAHKLTCTDNTYGQLTGVRYYDAGQNFLRRRTITYDPNGNKLGEEWSEQP